MPLLKQSKDGVLIEVLLQPAASRNRVQGVHADRLKVQITAPAVEKQANKALGKYLSEVLDVPKTSISIVKGRTSRRKQVLINGMTAEVVDNILLSHLNL